MVDVHRTSYLTREESVARVSGGSLAQAVTFQVHAETEGARLVEEELAQAR